MPRQFIKRFLPSAKKIHALKLQYYLGDRVTDQRLWVVNRLSISRATAIGLFCAYLPMPMEMLLAAVLAILLRANLPVSIMLVWLSNPLTWIVVYTPPYLLGLAITGETGITNISFDAITLDAMLEQFWALWIGCLIFGSGLAVSGYFLANVAWRMMVANRWTSRKNRNRVDNESNSQ